MQNCAQGGQFAMIRFYRIDMWYDATLSVNDDVGGEAFVTADGPDLGRSQSFFCIAINLMVCVPIPWANLM